ncbi:unnamed protein product [Parajaminaea phylloscopi]
MAPTPANTNRPAQRRRTSSSSRLSSASEASAHLYVDDPDDDEDDGGYDDRRSAGRSSASDDTHVPLDPPSAQLPEEEFAEIVAARAKGEHTLGGWHYAPLVIGVLPPLCSIFGGNANVWSDAILLVLATFWLFQTLKIPHDIYHAARTRRILQDDQLAEVRGESEDSPERTRRRLLAIAELQRAEVVALAACVLSPLVGGYILHWLQENLTDGQRYLNHFNIRLFVMAAGIRPWIHAFKLLRRRLLLLQEDVHYPSAKVESLQRRLARLEADLSSLRKTAVSKTDVRMLRDGIDVPLSQMSRSLKKYERKEEYLRHTAEDKFTLVESRLEDLLRECAINAELIETERLERERSSSFSRNVLEAFRFVLGQRASASGASRLHDPRALPPTQAASRAAIGAPSTWPIHGGGPNSPPWSSSPAGLVLRQRGNSTSHGAPGMARDASSASSLPGHTSQPGSPPRYLSTLPSGVPALSGSDVVAPASVSASDASMFSTPATPPSQWYERGLLYWAFLPVNLSNSVLRFAGDKLGPGAAPPITPLRAATRRRKIVGLALAQGPSSPTEAGRQGPFSAASNGHAVSQTANMPQAPGPAVHLNAPEAVEAGHAPFASHHHLAPSPAKSPFVHGAMGLGPGVALHSNGAGGIVTSLPAGYPSSGHSMMVGNGGQAGGPGAATNGASVHWKTGSGRLTGSRGLKV